MIEIQKVFFGKHTPLPVVGGGIGVFCLDTNFFTFGHAKRKSRKNKRPTRPKRNHATPSLNVWGSQECGTLLASSN